MPGPSARVATYSPAFRGSDASTSGSAGRAVWLRSGVEGLRELLRTELVGPAPGQVQVVLQLSRRLTQDQGPGGEDFPRRGGR